MSVHQDWVIFLAAFVLSAISWGFSATIIMEAKSYRNFSKFLGGLALCITSFLSFMAIATALMGAFY